MKKIVSILLGLLIILGLVFGGIMILDKMKLDNLEKEVVSYVAKEKEVDKNNITAAPYKSNLPGDRRYMVSIKVKGDKKLYDYFKDEETDKIKLESYTENGREKVVNN
ncbi:hypothetical protein [Macrococcoides caseolyticum]|uniref:hypothetical protein n=1 Tax=Macrococcoides caseolyticum TaxID=69966 RepID=UPI001F384783|nr:hypothetical protein [Macrococcus caseolyticus]MCE4958074.1 hypothetical protein [Macrococcus caseolyticus]